MSEEKRNIMEYINDEQVRNNAESVVSAIAAIFVVVITKGFIGEFTWGLFLTIEPYASAIGVGVATSIMQNNMITRGVSDEIIDNTDLTKIIKEVADLDGKITNYDYAEYFIDSYNKNEFDRLQKLTTEKEIRRLKYLVSISKSMKRKQRKYSEKLNYIIEYGAKVKGYKPVTLQDLLSFQAEDELKGSDKVNYKPVKTQQKSMAKTRLVFFLASGLVAGLPIASGQSAKETIVFLCIWIPLLAVTSLRTYINSRKITKSTYYKSLQYKKNVLKLCIDNEHNYTPPKEEEEFKKEDVIKEIAHE